MVHQQSLLSRIQQLQGMYEILASIETEDYLLYWSDSVGLYGMYHPEDAKDYIRIASDPESMYSAIYHFGKAMYEAIRNDECIKGQDLSYWYSPVTDPMHAAHEFGTHDLQQAREIASEYTKCVNVLLDGKSLLIDELKEE